jgi:DNA-binding transcriptional LysR family regulator
MKLMQMSDRIGRQIKLHDLHVLIAVIQAGSMSKAAALLNTGQPAISRSISELEHAFGVRLLDRSRQGVTPTEYGLALLDGGTAVFDDLRRTVKHVAFLADPTVGTIRLGCNPFLAATFVASIVDRLSLRYPSIVFELVTGYVDRLHRELTERNVDLLIARRSGPIPDDRMDFEFLFDETYSIVVGAQSPWARRRKVELAELLNQTWVLPRPESTLGSVVTDAFRAADLQYPRTAVVAEPAEVRIILLATGRFISIFPDSVLKFSGKRPELKILPIKQPLSRVPVGIVTLKNRTVGPLAQLVISTSREVARQLAKQRDRGAMSVSG